MLTPLHGGPRGGRRGPILAQKSAFFYATPIQPAFFRFRRTRLNGIISFPYPEVTLHNFSYLKISKLAKKKFDGSPNVKVIKDPRCVYVESEIQHFLNSFNIILFLIRKKLNVTNVTNIILFFIRKKTQCHKCHLMVGSCAAPWFPLIVNLSGEGESFTILLNRSVVLQYYNNTILLHRSVVTPTKRVGFD